MNAIIDSSNRVDFENTVSEGITLVDFWAPWCGPCRMQLPILEELIDSIEGVVKVAKVNVDEMQDVAAHYGVRAIPTLILFKDGKTVQRFIGVQPKEVLVGAIKNNL